MPRPALALVFGLLALSGMLRAQVAPNPKLKGYRAAEALARTRVYDVPIDGTIDLGLASFVERVVAKATADDVVLLKIKTFGGRVDGAVRIRDALLDARASTVAYVDRRAISAGALIALACDTIIMSDGASIGAATPVEQGQEGEMKASSEKVVSYMRAEMRATAEAKGRPAEIAEAMVDPDVEIKDVTPKGKLLTLTSEEAIRLKIADAVVPSYDDALVLLNLKGAPLVHEHTHWGEQVARVLTDPTISGLLMTFGVLGLLMELYTAGFGLGGVVGLTCLALFFLGQYAASLAGWEELLLFVVGAVLMLVEVLVLPGFGVAGVLGILFMGAGLIMAMIELHLPVGVAFELGYLQEALTSAFARLGIAMVALVIGVFAFGKFFPGTRVGKRLILETATSAEQGFRSEPAELRELVGKRGRATSPLRPAGIADFGGKRVDVVSQGGFIAEDSAVEVLRVDGNRVVVREIENKA